MLLKKSLWGQAWDIGILKDGTWVRERIIGVKAKQYTLRGFKWGKKVRGKRKEKE